MIRIFTQIIEINIGEYSNGENNSDENSEDEINHPYRKNLANRPRATSAVNRGRSVATRIWILIYNRVFKTRGSGCQGCPLQPEYKSVCELQREANSHLVPANR